MNRKPKDQNGAFEWVFKHAVDYGANPNDIWLFGYSMGSYLIADLMSQVFVRSHAAGVIVGGGINNVSRTQYSDEAKNLPPLLMFGDISGDKLFRSAGRAYTKATGNGKNVRLINIPGIKHVDVLDVGKVFNKKMSFELYEKMMVLTFEWLRTQPAKSKCTELNYMTLETEDCGF